MKTRHILANVLIGAAVALSLLCCRHARAELKFRCSVCGSNKHGSMYHRKKTPPRAVPTKPPKPGKPFKATPRGWSFLEQAHKLAAEGKWGRAAYFALQAGKGYPDWLEAHLWAGYYSEMFFNELLKTGRNAFRMRDQAITSYKMALAADRANAYARRRLFELLAALNKSQNQTVVSAAYTYPDGGGYGKPVNGKWQGTGVSHDVVVNGNKILDGSNSGTYCSGFTFSVVTLAAEKGSLLKGKTARQIRRFQREWFGATKAAGEKQCVTALENLKVGKEVPFAQAQRGDFVQFWRTRSGHSAVFLEWVRDSKGKIIGLKYRSSQGSTDGIADNIEYFHDVKGKGGYVDRKRTYFGRLGPPRPPDRRRAIINE